MNSDPKNPLEVAQLLDRSGTNVYRDEATGVYIVGETMPPTLLTRAQYEAGRRVQEIRDKAATDARR